MVYNGIIEGQYVTLRSVMVEDALFTLAIRQDARLTEYLPKLDITLEQQVAWIKKQQKDPTDYFFVVWDKKEKPVGTIGVYHIEDGEGETGRLAMKGNPFQAMEAQMLCADFVFDTLCLKKLKSYIYAGNQSAIRFSALFCPNLSKPYKNNQGELVHSTENTKELYQVKREALQKILYRNKKVDIQSKADKEI